MSDKNCEICTTTISKYSCPRCDILYCSVSCYKSEKHSNCSEEFYKESILAELKGQNVDTDSPAKMLEILKRLNDQNDYLDPLARDDGTEEDLVDGEEEVEQLDSDDEDGTDIAERLKDVNLNNGDEVWDKLTDAEREQFKQLVDSGNIFDLVPEKEPWYITHENIPDIRPKITEYSKISSKPPADSVQFNLINIIAAYSYMTRYFMSDQESLPVEVCNCLYALSASLKRSCEFNSVDMAIMSLYVEGISHQFEVDKEMQPTLCSDVRKIILGPSESKVNASEKYILALLSDMIHSFKKLKKMDASSGSSESSTSETTKPGSFMKQFDQHSSQPLIPVNTITPIVKRLEYFLSYTKNFYSDQLLQLIN